MTQTNRSDTPVYKETEATTWLAWLARAMQRHGRTIFLIEQLQPMASLHCNLALSSD